MSEISMAPSPPPRFLDQVRQAALQHFNRPDAAERCVDWSRRFILFHNKRHPATMGAVEVAAFLHHVAATWAGVRIVDELENARAALPLTRMLGVPRMRAWGWQYLFSSRNAALLAYLPTRNPGAWDEKQKHLAVGPTLSIIEQGRADFATVSWRNPFP